MALDRGHIGRTYGPFLYEVGLEKIREFAAAISDAVPSAGFGYGDLAASDGGGKINPLYFDEAAGKASRHGSVIAPPTFAVVFAIRPFAAASSEPALGIDLLRLVHGEQEFELLEVIRPGDRLSTVGRIADIQQKRDLDFLTLVTESTNQHGRLAVRGTWTAIIRN